MEAESEQTDEASCCTAAVVAGKFTHPDRLQSGVEQLFDPGAVLEPCRMKGIAQSHRQPRKQEQTGMVVLLVVVGVLALSALMLATAHDRAQATLDRFEPG